MEGDILFVALLSCNDGDEKYIAFHDIAFHDIADGIVRGNAYICKNLQEWNL